MDYRLDNRTAVMSHFLNSIIILCLCKIIISVFLGNIHCGIKSKGAQCMEKGHNVCNSSSNGSERNIYSAHIYVCVDTHVDYTYMRACVYVGTCIMYVHTYMYVYEQI